MIYTQISGNFKGLGYRNTGYSFRGFDLFVIIVSTTLKQRTEVNNIRNARAVALATLGALETVPTLRTCTTIGFDLMRYLPNIVKIDLSAVVENLSQVRRLLDPKTKIMGIVKSDAYGHGLLPVSRVLEGEGVQCLGVAHLHEALELRQNGIKIPIVILCGIKTREECNEVVEKDLTPVVYDMNIAELLSTEGVRKGKRVPIQLKVDTGMGQLGMPLESVESFIKKIMKYAGLHPEALISHLSSADESNADFTKIQIDNFKRAIELCKDLGLEFPLNNLANSAGIMAHKDAHFNMVRPGIMLYGGMPSPDFPSKVDIRPVMGFHGRILQIRDHPDGSPISYGRTFHTKGYQKIAVISAGYGDGLPRRISNKGWMLIKGKRVNMVGSVCMNMVMADITGMKDIRPGEEVVFLGRQGDEMIQGDEFAEWGETIAYEIFCSIGRRAPREYMT